PGAAAPAGRVRGAPVAQGFPARRPGGARLAGGAGTRRARDIGPLSSAPGPAGSTRRLAPGMTLIGQERPGGHAPVPPAHREPGPAIPSQGPAEPVTAGPGEAGPAPGGRPRVDLGGA